MKLVLLALSFVFASSAFANRYAIECDGKYNNQKIKVGIEQNFGGRFDPVRADVILDGVRTSYEVRGGRFGMYDLSYDNRGFSLRVTLWPDRNPQWGSIYDGTFIGDAVNNQRVRNLRCRFPLL